MEPIRPEIRLTQVTSQILMIRIRMIQHQMRMALVKINLEKPVQGKMIRPEKLEKVRQEEKLRQLKAVMENKLIQTIQLQSMRLMITKIQEVKPVLTMELTQRLMKQLILRTQ